MHPAHDCKGEVCLQPSDGGLRVCHHTNELLTQTPDGLTYYDVFMNRGRA